MRSLFLSIVIVITSCNGQKKTTFNSSEGATTTKNHRLTLLLQDNYSGSDSAETLIIKDVKTLKVFYSRINRTRKPGLPLPKVDFTKEIVLVHCMGEQRVGALSSLSIFEETDNELVLKIKNITAKKKETSPVSISPFSVYKLPITKKKISFKKEEY
ncbi:MAG: hypothetical protein KAJ23_15605 [Maribacter sp.]|nr:hypothetical protein [Maribacter sp.]